MEQRGGVEKHGDLGADGGSVRLGLQVAWSLGGVEQCEGVEQREEWISGEAWGQECAAGYGFHHQRRRDFHFCALARDRGQENDLSHARL